MKPMRTEDLKPLQRSIQSTLGWEAFDSFYEALQQRQHLVVALKRLRAAVDRTGPCGSQAAFQVVKDARESADWILSEIEKSEKEDDDV